jgi:hypothetical protein
MVGTKARILRNRDREFAAGQEARRLARQGRQIRLRQDGDQALGLERIDQGIGVEIIRVIGTEQIVDVALRAAGQGGGVSRQELARTGHR